MKTHVFSQNFLNRLSIVKKLIPVIVLSLFFASCSSDDDEDDDFSPPTNLNAEMLEGDFDELHLTNKFDDPQEADYIIVGDVAINVELKIDPGVRVEAEEDMEIVIEESAHVVASGSDQKNIILTTANQAAGQYWKGIRINSSDARNSLSYTVVEYAANSNFSIGPFSSQNRSAAIAVDDDAVLSLTNCKIQNNASYGVFVRGEINDFQANEFTDNDGAGIASHVRNAGAIDEASTFSGNSFNGVEITGGTIALPTEWSRLSSDAFYKITEDISVEAHLTVHEGTLLHFDEDVEIVVDEGASGTSHDGIIEVKGSASNPVLFTSSNHAGGQHWKGLRVNTSDLRNSLDHAIFEYGGESRISIGPFSSQNRETNIAVDEDAYLAFGTVTSSHSKGWGIAAILSDDIDISNADLTYEGNTQGDLEIVDE